MAGGSPRRSCSRIPPGMRRMAMSSSCRTCAGAATAAGPSGCCRTMRRTARRRSPGAADHPACDGRVAMYGFSYQAMTQLLGARRRGESRHETTDAIAPAMGAWTIDGDWASEGGCSASRRTRLGDPDGGRAGAARGRPAGLRGAHGRRGRCRGRADPATAGGDAAARPLRRPLPALALGRSRAFAMAPARALAGLAPDVPALFVGGWFDIMLKGTLAMHEAFSGPRGGSSSVPGRICPGAGGRASSISDGGLLGHRPRDDPLLRPCIERERRTGPPVRLFDLGATGMDRPRRDAHPGPLALGLSSGGLAATTSTDGRLGPLRATASTGWCMIPGGRRRWWAVPSVSPGLQDRAALDDRTDVAVYTSDRCWRRRGSSAGWPSNCMSRATCRATICIAPCPGWSLGRPGADARDRASEGAGRRRARSAAHRSRAPPAPPCRRAPACG